MPYVEYVIHIINRELHLYCVKWGKSDEFIDENEHECFPYSDRLELKVQIKWPGILFRRMSCSEISRLVLTLLLISSSYPQSRFILLSFNNSQYTDMYLVSCSCRVSDSRLWSETARKLTFVAECRSLFDVLTSTSPGWASYVTITKQTHIRSVLKVSSLVIYVVNGVCSDIYFFNVTFCAQETDDVFDGRALCSMNFILYRYWDHGTIPLIHFRSLIMESLKNYFQLKLGLYILTK